MSKYKVIKTEYTSQAALTAALEAAGIPFEVHDDDAPATLYGYLGDERQEKAHVIVRRAHIGDASNDLGWYWDAETKAYQAIISVYDLRCTQTTNIRDRIRREYAANKVVQEARKRGLQIEINRDSQSKQIRLKLTGRVPTSRIRAGRR